MNKDELHFRLRHPRRAFQNWHWDYFGFPFKLKYYWQRIHYGICDADSWNFDNYIAETVCLGMLKLIDGAGYPCVIYDEKNKEIYVHRHKYDAIEPQLSDNEYAANHHRGIITWNQVLQDIADGFKAYLDREDQWYMPGTKEHKDATKKFRKGMGLLMNNFGSFWD
jgi:hypothetical protein